MDRTRIRLNGEITCCKDCTDRHRACHDSCQRYIAEKAKCDAIRAARRAQSDYDIVSDKKQRIYEAWKKRRKK